MSCAEGQNSSNLDQAVLKFPNINVWKFRPDEAVRSANVLIAAGQDAACASLERVGGVQREFPENNRVNERVCLLCRLLFVPQSNSVPLRPPWLGGPELLPWHSMKDEDWPDSPFVIAESVPLSISSGYSLEGNPESARRYIAYCKSNGVFRAKMFPIPTRISASNALQQVLTSPAWKALKWQDSGPTWTYKLSEDHAKEGLWSQVGNISELEGISRPNR